MPRLYHGFQRALDANGDPVPGALLTVRLAGTFLPNVLRPRSGGNIAAMLTVAGLQVFWDGTGTAPDGSATGPTTFIRNPANDGWIATS